MIPAASVFQMHLINAYIRHPGVKSLEHLNSDSHKILQLEVATTDNDSNVILLFCFQALLETKGMA